MLRRVSIAAFTVAAAFAAATLPVPAQDDPAEKATFSNVKVLTHVESKSEMRTLMKKQSAALGVKCSQCHVPGKFALDEKEDKLRARKMQQMVMEINAKYFPDAEEPAVTCWTCHRGSQEPEHDVPPELLAKDDD